ncbi:MAG: domain S-box protein [Bacilli bacterium]|nr:domain S-box protein [Bacilli bacterium]
MRNKQAASIGLKYSDQMELQRLQTIELRYQSLVEHNTAMMCTFDLAGRLLSCNPAFELATGYREEELLLKSLESLIVDSERIHASDHFERAVRGESVNLITRMVNINGQVQDIGVKLIPVYSLDQIIEIHAVGKDITEQKKLEEQLRRSEDSLALAQRIARLGNFDVDLLTRRMHWSDEMFQILDIAPDQISPSYEMFLNHVHPEDRDYVSSSVKQAMVGSRFNIEFRIVCGDGSTRLCHSRGELIVDGTGRAVRAVGFMQDITEKRQEQEKLLEVEQLYNLISENAQDIISCSAPDGTCVYVSPAVRTLLGYDPEEVLGQRVAASWHPDDLAELMKRTFADVDMFSCRVRHKKGHYVWFETTFKNIRNENGDIQLVVGVGRDITERMQAEELLRQSQRRLALAQRIAHIGNWERNPVDDIIYWSDEMYRIFGLEPLTHMTLEQILNRIHPDDVKLCAQLFTVAVLGNPYQVEYRIIRSNGEVRFVHSQCEGQLTEGQVVSIIGTTQDITERKLAEQALQESEERWHKSEKLSSIGQLAAGVAHEIKNPLTSLKGFTQLLQSTHKAARQDYFDIMLKELDRIDWIVGEMLILAKPQVHHFELKQLEPLIQDVVTLLNTQVILNNIELIYEFESDVPLIYCEANQLKQVFLNLIKNAIESMPEGGRIVIKIKDDGEQIRIRICDQGEGIPADRLAKLGEPFYTTKENGTGLGLMISQKIIAAHGGTLDLFSELGKGTTVNIALPRT